MSSMNHMTLRGIIPAVVTPLTEEDGLDEDSLRTYARWVRGHEGLGGVAVNMDTGEGPHLTKDERTEIIRIWQEENEGQVPVLAGITARYTAEAVQQARETEEAGADGLVVFPIPTFIGRPLDPEIPYRYHKAIAEAVDLPLVLFQLQPALAGVIFEPDTLARLVSIDNVVAIKEASFDAVMFTQTVSLLQSLDKQITILTGNDNFIYESFVLGATGALIGFGTVAIREQIEMAEAALAQNYTRAKALWERLKPLEETLFAQPVRDYRARTKAALKMMGIIRSDYMRPPLLRTGEAERARIEAALKEAGAWEAVATVDA